MIRNAIGLLVFCSALLGCSSTPSEDRISCENSDWYEIGRRDGASGATLERVEGYRRSCSGQFGTESENIYRNGRNAGLVEYCTGRNGYEMGRMRVNYNAVCPSTMESDFLKSYEKGSHARVIEMQSQKLSAEIDDVSQQLNSRSQLTPDQKNYLSEKLETLRKARTDNEQMLNEMSR